MGADQQGAWPRPRQVVCIDTGDALGGSQWYFEDVASGMEEPFDENGHGTSIASLVRRMAPSVNLHSFRALRRGNSRFRSSDFLLALSAATTQLPVIQVICVALRADIEVDQWGHRDQFMETVRQRRGRYPAPVVVCAAGNEGPRESMAFPATVPGLVVATALTPDGHLAEYNCSPPAEGEVITVCAPGGTEAAELGELTRNGGSPQGLWGSSYAAAVVAAAFTR
jgi:subtilisin family serine protease